MNRLSSETSPYLRQHADNPVNWYPWSQEAFATAGELDRPVMLSVGYSSCHWCHVMADESFEDEQTAAELNSRFVSVKVDREERPDVDAVYMEAVQALSGRGGWPMTVFLTPDRRPFFAGTYYPARDMHGMPSFRRVLDAVHDAWVNRRSEVEGQADALLDAVSRRASVPEGVLQLDQPTSVQTSRAGAAKALESATSELRARFEPAWGGFSPAPKFPHPTLLELCLQHHRLSGEEASLSMATRTLDAMASGGMYDQLGGGFHRYSTDDSWTVPHFEKMLYDQAGMVRAYLHAWQATGERRWMAVVEETVGYVLRDLASGSGGLYSSEDADSEGEEGRFYAWTTEEIGAVLDHDRAAATMAWYQVTEAGNFEGRSVLRRPLGGAPDRPAEVESGRAALFEARAERVRPGRDDKVLTEWNAMFAAALAEAAGATGRDDWARAALHTAEFLHAELRRAHDGRWLRSWQDGRTQHLAYAADYAWVVELFTRLSELTGRAVWLDRASETASAMIELFAQGDSLLYTTGHDAEELVVRPMEMSDGATPSATSVAAGALMRLGALTGDDDLSATGESMLGALLELGSGQPLAVSNAVACSLLASGGVIEVLVGGDRDDLLAACRARYEPSQVVAWGEPTRSPLWEGRNDPVAYVCRNYTCRAPSRSVDELLDRLDSELEESRARFAELAGV